MGFIPSIKLSEALTLGLFNEYRVAYQQPSRAAARPR